MNEEAPANPFQLAAVWIAAFLVLIFVTVFSFINLTLHDLFVSTGLIFLLWIAFLGLCLFSARGMITRIVVAKAMEEDEQKKHL